MTAEPSPEAIRADHPYSDPGDGRSECRTCGKWIWPVTHSCKGVPVTEAARARRDLLESDGFCDGHCTHSRKGS